MLDDWVYGRQGCECNDADISLGLGLEVDKCLILSVCFFFSSRRRHTRSVSAFLLNRSSDLKHSVDRFVIVSIFIPKLRLILILNSFLGSSDSLVFSELFHSLAPRPLAARSISDFLLTYLAT